MTAYLLPFVSIHFMELDQTLVIETPPIHLDVCLLKEKG